MCVDHSTHVSGMNIHGWVTQLPLALHWPYHGDIAQGNEILSTVRTASWGLVWSIEENKTLTQICIVLSMVLSCQLAGGSFEVMLFLFWEFFNRDLCLHVWFAEGIFKLNSHLAPVLHWVLASHEWVAKELWLGTWDWLWFLDFLAEWLLLSPKPLRVLISTMGTMTQSILNVGCYVQPAPCSCMSCVHRSYHCELQISEKLSELIMCACANYLHRIYNLVCIKIYPLEPIHMSIYTHQPAHGLYRELEHPQIGVSLNVWGLETHSLLEPGRNVCKCLAWG